MTVSASTGGRSDRHGGWYGLSGTAGSQDPVLPPLPEPRQYGRSAGRHTEGISVSELVLRDDTGALPTTGAVITASGRLRRHANPLSLTRGTAATRVTTAAVLVGGTAVGVIGAVAGPSFIPPVDDSPLHSPEAAPGAVSPIPGLPGQATGAPQIIAFSTSAESLGLTGGALGGARTGTSSLPGAPGAPVPGVTAPGAGGPVAGGGAGTGGGGLPAPGGPGAGTPGTGGGTPGTPGTPGGGNPGTPGGGSGSGGSTPVVPIIIGAVTDTGSTVGSVPVLGPVLGPVVQPVTNTVGQTVDQVQKTVVAPAGAVVGGTVDTVGGAASGLPVVGGTVNGLTNTVSDVTTIVTGGGAAPSGPGVSGTAGTLLTDVGSTVGTVAPPLAKPVQLTTSTAADFVARTTGTVTAPVTSTLDTVGTATKDVPAVGPTLKRTTDTAGAVVGTLLNGAERSTSSDDSTASDSDDSAETSSGATSSSDESSDESSDDSTASDSDEGGASSSDEGSGSSDEGDGDLVTDTVGTVTGLLGR